MYAALRATGAQAWQPIHLNVLTCLYFLQKKIYASFPAAEFAWMQNGLLYLLKTEG